MGKYFDKEVQEEVDKIDTFVKYKMKQRAFIANSIDQCRKDKGLTQRAFAEILGKNESEISKWLTGFHHFEDDTLSLIEFKLGCKIHRHPPTVEYVLLYGASKQANVFTRLKAVSSEDAKDLMEIYECVVSYDKPNVLTTHLT